MNNYIVFGILLTLIKHKKCSCGFLAEKFEVSKKTVYRYINQLSASGVPIYASQGKNGGIEILPDFDLESNFFTTDEIARISTLLSTCEISRIDKTTQSVIEKINHTLNRRMLKWGTENLCDQIIIDNLPWGVSKLYNEKILLLLDACNRNQIISIDYVSRNNEQSKRIINPYSLILKDGIWYLYAFCKLKQDFRLFKCSRIENIILLHEEFNRLPRKIEEKPWLNKTDKMGEEIELCLEVKPPILPDIHDWLNDFEICFKSNENVIIKSRAVNNDGLISRLLNFGANIKVISPNSVAKKLVNVCTTIANEYKSLLTYSSN